MNQKIIFPILLGLIFGAVSVGMFFYYPNLTSTPVNNTNSTRINTSGPAVIPSGETVKYDESFSRPDFSTLKQFCLSDGTCFRHTSRYLPCSFTSSTETVSLMDSAETCVGLSDAPAMVVEEMPKEYVNGSVSTAYARIFQDPVLTTEQNTSDEIVGSVKGRTISCFDTKRDRVCAISFPDGRTYSLDGRYYHSTDSYYTITAQTKQAFDAIVRSMMEE